jgi:intraflagellar transport protein 140
MFYCQGNKVEVCSHKGTTKQSLAFTESEGEPFLLDVNGDFMAVATRLNVVRLFDLTRREVRPHGASRKFESKDGFTAPGTYELEYAYTCSQC